MLEDRFIPGTMEREVAKNIVFRPVRSWHSNTFAGEGLYQVKGDGSGCLLTDGKLGIIRNQTRLAGTTIELCLKPLTVTHRVYWNKKRPNEHISAFLSYPNGMGVLTSYFWEVMIGDDIERFDFESDMERRVIEVLSK